MASGYVKLGLYDLALGLMTVDAGLNLIGRNGAFEPVVVGGVGETGGSSEGLEWCGFTLSSGCTDVMVDPAA